MKPPTGAPIPDPQAVREQVAFYLHDELGQQLIGTLLMAQALTHHLEQQASSEAGLAEKVVRNLADASAEVGALIDWLDDGRPR